MRKKLILILVLSIVILVLLVIQQPKKKFGIVDDKDIKSIYLKDIKDNKEIVNGKVNTTPLFNTINDKYELIKEKDTYFCDNKIKGSIIKSEDKYTIIYAEQDGFYKGFKYYKVDNKGKCEPMGKIEDVTFSKLTNEAFANDSVYTFFESINDVTLNGLVRINNKGNTSYDSEKIRFTSPAAYDKGVLLVENYTNIVGFDDNDKQILRQDNSNKNAKVYAINTSGSTLFVFIEIKEKRYIEVYDLSKKEDIEKGKYVYRKDVTKFFSEIDGEVKIKSSADYVSFATANNTIILKNDLSSIYELASVSNVIGFSNDYVLIRIDTNYYVVDLINNTKESLADIGVMDVIINDQDIILSVLNNDQSYYFRFTLK